MRARKSILLLLVWAVLALSLTGCWNYREIDDMAIVAGVAIDKNEDGKLELTVEIVDAKGSRDNSIPGSKIVSLTGDTMFGIVRGLLSLTGKKLFWSHATTIIISEKVAKDGVNKVLDWYTRDTETRADVNMFISKEKTAKEIFTSSSTTNQIISFELSKTMVEEDNLSTAPNIQIWDLLDRMESEGRSAIAPTVYLLKGKKNISRISGMAAFVKDKMVGTLNGEETKYCLMANNYLKGGLIVLELGDDKSLVLEILDSKTKYKTAWVDGKPQIDLAIMTEVALDEINFSSDLMQRSTIAKFEALAEEEIESQIERVVKKVHMQYDCDLMGFGMKFDEQMPKLWDKIKKDWRKVYLPQLIVKVESKVVIKNTAKTTRTIREGD
jgi:spore germination protein KC